MSYTLPALGYDYDALEPYIDTETMRIHHTKHHQTYVDKLNAALEPYPHLQSLELGSLLGQLATLDIPDTVRLAIRNHGGGHANHSFFWNIIGPEKKIDASLIAEITSTFGSLDDFKKKFSDGAAAVFGSGWMWLVRDQAGKLALRATPNQDSPILDQHVPLIGLDVWEHAYYVKHQNRRADYISAWWSVLRLLP